MLVSAKEMLDKAKAGHYAVGQFNINNLESVSYTHLAAIDDVNHGRNLSKPFHSVTDLMEDLNA